VSASESASAPEDTARNPSTDRRHALLALLLLAPVPSLGVLAAMVVFPGPVGKAIFTAAKVWLLALPAAWYLLVEKGTPSWSPPRKGGLGVGLASGALLAAFIVLGARLFGVHEMDLGPLRTEVQAMGLQSVLPYLAGAAAAIIASAAVFTAHHIIAVSQYLAPLLTLLASAGVFAGGLVWSWLYLRYRSIWPCWLSHVLADVAVFGIGGWLLFG
jgi:hypothetical protein